MRDQPPGTVRASLQAWVRSLPLPWLIALAAVAVVIAAAVAFGGYTAYDYTMTNPAFCRSCHIMEAAWDRWATSEHRKVDCHSCHQQSITASARQVIVFAFRHPERVGKHAEVPAGRCRTCHTSGDPTWRQVAQTAGHQVHAERKGIECVVCHSPGLHRFQPPTEVCANCHQAQAKGDRAIKIKEMADFHCVDCHQYLRPDSPLRPTRQTCLGCHQGLPTKKTVGWPAGAPMAYPCSQCHKPHEKAQPVVVCTSCHQGPLPGLHRWTTHAATSCTTCHIPHAWKVQSRQTCLSCHQDRTTHKAPENCSNCHGFR